MLILIKFILRNIREQKFRTFLILFSITLSSALFFASIALSGTLEHAFLERVKKYVGTAEIIIHGGPKSPTGLFTLAPARKYADRLEYAVGSLEMRATYKNLRESLNFDLRGFDLDELEQLSPFLLARQSSLRPFTGNKIVLSRKTAEQLKLDVGDNIELKLREGRHRFRIVGIAESSGIFQEDGRSNTALVPADTLARLFEAPGRVTMAFIKLKDPARIEAMIQILSREYRRYIVREPFSKAELRRYTESVTTPFLIMVVLVLFMSVFIIYSSFKVITRERLPVIGTFRSIGASRRITDLIMFAESILYGCLGGAFGCLLGVGILQVMSALMTPESLSQVGQKSQFGPGHLLAAFGLAVLLPALSSAWPIIKIAKLPVKEIILNAMERPLSKKRFRWMAGLLCLGLAAGAPFLAPKAWALPIDILCMLLTVAAAVLLIPYLTAGFLKLLEQIYSVLLGNEGVLAAKNLRENKSILNNISLLTIGISSLLMINTVSFSVIKEVVNFFKDGEFAIWMEYYQADRRFEAVLRGVKGVSGVYGVYEVDRVDIDGTKERINLIHGIHPHRHQEFWNVNLGGERRADLKELDQGRNLLLSAILRDKLGVKAGDRLPLKLARGRRVYRVIGFFDSLMWNGSYALASARFLKLDAGLQYYGDVFVKTAEDPTTVAERIQKKFQRNRPWVQTMRQITQDELNSIGKMFLLLQGFSVMTMIIGIFGVFNNLIISFLERRRSLAMMRSVGMSKGQTVKMILIESVTGGIIGGSVGILTGTALIELIPFLMRAINQAVPVHYSLREYLIAFGAGVVITVLASISPALNSSKLNIIEAIKYE